VICFVAQLVCVEGDGHMAGTTVPLIPEQLEEENHAELAKPVSPGN